MELRVTLRRERGMKGRNDCEKGWGGFTRSVIGQEFGGQL
jgi:hypothetical protein